MNKEDQRAIVKLKKVQWVNLKLEDKKRIMVPKSILLQSDHAIKISGQETNLLLMKILKKVISILWINTNQVQESNKIELFTIKTVKDLDWIDISQ